MPPKKKQKTNTRSRTAANEQEQEDQGAASPPHKNDKNNDKGATDGNKDILEKRDAMKIPDDEYVCMMRPLFDYEAENRALGKDAVDRNEVFEKYRDISNDEIDRNVVDQPAKDFPERKWVILWEGWKFLHDHVRRAKYCSPDRFSMYISNDFEGWGLQELMENMIVAFDAALKKKDNVVQTWAIVSGLAQWLNEADMGPFLGNEYGEKVKALTRLVGYALLCGLAAIDQADELKADGKFLDVPIVITSFLEWSHDLPQYGIEGDAIEWRPHAVAYFKKGKYDASKGISTAKKLLDGVKGANQKNLPSVSQSDPWSWKTELQAYKNHYAIRGKIGGTSYDITRMTRKERAGHAYDGVDPLKDVPVDVLREGRLDFD